MTGLERCKLTKLYCDKTWTFADNETEMDYNTKLSAFREANEKDGRQEFFCGIVIPQFKSPLLAEVSPGVKPKYLDMVYYWVASVFILSVFYRHWFDSIVGRKKYTFVKQVSIH